MSRRPAAGEGVEDYVVAGGDHFEKSADYPMVLWIIERRVGQNARQFLMRGATVLVEHARQDLALRLMQIAFEIGHARFVGAEMNAIILNGFRHFVRCREYPSSGGNFNRFARFRVKNLV